MKLARSLLVFLPALVTASAVQVGCGGDDASPDGLGGGGDAGTPAVEADGSTPSTGLTCAAPKTACTGGSCSDLQTDRENCGACGTKCAPSEVCSLGTCGLTCAGGTTKCGDKCVDTTTDEKNCGACGATCGAGQTCAAGADGGAACVCAPGLTNCGGACVDTATDEAHCGGCGATCTGGSKECAGSVCRTGPISAWLFEDNLDDANAKNNGVADGTMSYQTPSWSQGRGKALVLDNTNTVSVATPVDVPLGATARTLEAWVRATGSSDAIYNGILSYGDRATSNAQLLSLRSNRWASSANYAGNDLIQYGGVITADTWSHVAFTYDGAMRHLYIDGIEVASDVPSPIDTKTGELRIGATDVPAGRRFVGWIDDVKIYDYARSAAALRKTANMDTYYALDAANDTLDSGPNKISAGTKAGGVTATANRKNVADSAIALDGQNGTYFQIYPNYNLGKSFRPYTIMAWVKPAVANGIVAHVSSQSDGAGWCVAMLGINTAGKPTATSWVDNTVTVTADDAVVADTWVHLATSWSASTLKLYVNGVLKAQVPQQYFSAGNLTKYITLGTNQGKVGCAGSQGMGNFNGAIDEFRVYDRELDVSEILAEVNK